MVSHKELAKPVRRSRPPARKRVLPPEHDVPPDLSSAFAKLEAALADIDLRLPYGEGKSVEARTQRAVAAHYDSGARKVVVSLESGVQVLIPVERTEGLAGAAAEELAMIEISPSGLGLHWPKLDADVYVPGVLAGALGSRKWMAAQLGKRGGQKRTPAKAAASRENGKLGGRPRIKSGAGSRK